MIDTKQNADTLAKLQSPGFLSMEVIAHGPDAVYLRLPAELQRDCNGCGCSYCEKHPKLTPMWDTLAVPTKRRVSWRR
jgi:hypothetical protein